MRDYIVFRKLRRVNRGIAVITALLFTLIACGVPKLTPKGLISLKSDSASKGARRGGRYALLIGIGKYKDPKWNPLVYPESDVDGLADLLLDKELGNFDELIKIKSSEATKKNILAGLEELRKKNRTEEDIVLIYFSNHGSLDYNGTGSLSQYLIAHDTSFNAISSTALEIRELIDIFSGFISEKKALILTACHSGTGKSVIRDDILRDLKNTKSPLFIPPSLVRVSKASIVISSSGWRDPSYEDPKLKGDVYTHYFIKALRNTDNTDINRDGAVTVSEAHSFAREKTYAYTKGRQMPSIHGAIAGMDPINITGSFSTKGDSILYSGSEALVMVDVMVDGEKKGTLPGSISIEPGRHEVWLKKFTERDPFLKRTIDVKRGDRISIEQLKNGVRKIKTVGLRFGYINSPEIVSGNWVEVSYVPFKGLSSGKLTLKWDTALKYTTINYDKTLTSTNYTMSNYLLLNIKVPNIGFLDLQAGAGVDIGTGILESTFSEKVKSRHKKFINTSVAVLGMKYSAGGLYFNLNARYNFLTATKYMRSIGRSQYEEKEYDYNGLAFGIGGGYSF